MNQVQPVLCYISLGSNMGDAQGNLQQAVKLLDMTEGIKLGLVAPFYRTEPWGYTDQDYFINTVAEIITTLTPLELLASLQHIENQSGRVRTLHWGPRTLDLDLLLYGDEKINLPELVVPHPLMHQRAFVVVPLADLNSGLMVQGEPIADLARRLAREQFIAPVMTSYTSHGDGDFGW